MIILNDLLNKIDDCILKDNGLLFRQRTSYFLSTIKSLVKADDGFSYHLGASLMGDDCARKIWLKFRWFFKEEVSPRMQRLFHRGSLEEARFLALLDIVGSQLYYQKSDGQQYSFSELNGAIGGSCDGVAAGVPSVEGNTLLEFKTMNTKSFANLQKNGCYIAQERHYVQQVVYMYKFGLPQSVYFVVNKDTDELHAELIYADNEAALAFLKRACDIVHYNTVPVKNYKASWYKCKMCSFYAFCHKGEKHGIQLNCRTCAYFVFDGEFSCTKFNKSLSKQEQKEGCSSWSVQDNGL